MRVGREQPNSAWKPFVDGIERFDYALGTEYVLEEEVETVMDPSLTVERVSEWM